MAAARARAEGDTRLFRPDEHASMRTVSDVTREELLVDPFHPKIGGHRPIDCECGHADIGEHNAAVSDAARRRVVLQAGLPMGDKARGPPAPRLSRRPEDFEEEKHGEHRHAGDTFRRVLGALMRKRGIPAELQEMMALAERSGFDGEKFLARVADANAPDVGPLSGLDREMGLSEPERVALAEAYVFEKDPPCATPGCERLALLGDEFGDCTEHRAEYEAWDLAWKILAPWVEATREIGSDELTRVMEEALAKADGAWLRGRDKLERAEAALGGQPTTRNRS